jgi:RecA-family ATPase
MEEKKFTVEGCTILPAPSPNGGIVIKHAFQFCEEAATRPTPPMLAGSLFYQGEICILFAETSAGKSLLAVQIADCLARGANVMGVLRNEANPLKVIYADFELSDKQFQTRYTNSAGDIYPFHDNMYRAELGSEGPPDGMGWDDYIMDQFNKIIQDIKPEVLIIDNITYLETDAEKAKKAAPLMKKLKELVRKYDVTMLVIAHTPKRDHSRPITRNDLAGSKMLINFTDSAFAIGESASDTSLRYIKQIKTRFAEVVYDAENVILASIEKENNFTGFTFIGYGSERDHLKELGKKEISELDAKIVEFLQTGQSYREVAKALNVSIGKVQKAKRRYEDTNTPF